MNASSILSTKEYSNESTRGTSNLTINADGTDKVISSGLDKSYITEYSCCIFRNPKFIYT